MLNLQQRIEAGVIGSKELVATSTIPVNGIVNLLDVDTRAAGGSKIGKVLRVCQDIILCALVSHQHPLMAQYQQ